MTSKAADEDPAKLLRAAQAGPVMITEDGKATHVMVTYAEYQRMLAEHAKNAKPEIR